MQFDPKSAAASFAQSDVDELVRIAFLEQDYIEEEAKELAKAELASRGLKITAQDIEGVRLRLEERKREALEYSLRNFERDHEIPGWRRRVRARLVPYRRALAGVTLLIMGLAELNNIFEWGIMHLSGRKSESLAAFIGGLVMVFIIPSRDDYLAEAESKKNSTSAR